MKSLMVFDLDGTSGTKFLRYDGQWTQLYAETIKVRDPEETGRVIEAVIACVGG
jgi:hypothetical protein